MLVGRNQNEDFRHFVFAWIDANAIRENTDRDFKADSIQDLKDSCSVVMSYVSCNPEDLQSVDFGDIWNMCGSLGPTDPLQNLDWAELVASMMRQAATDYLKR